MNIIFLLMLIVPSTISYVKTSSLEEAKPQYVIDVSFEKETNWENVDLEDIILGGPFNEWRRDTIIITNIHDTIKAISDEDAYLQTYYRICDYLIKETSREDEYWDENDPIVEHRLKKVKILNREGKNIIPYMNFSDKKEKERMIWEEIQEDYCFKKMYQPQIKQRHISQH